MIQLIAESGSTKTDWTWVGENLADELVRTSGINPEVNNLSESEEELQMAFAPEAGPSPDRVHFYGAGLLAEANRERVADMLRRLWPHAEVAVNTDMLAAARATCFDSPGIVGILGTGSNCCLYDGKRITARIGGNGYILGDEGSGADLGKALLKAALEHGLPPATVEELEHWAGRSVLDLRRELHGHSRPNVFLAGFSEFLLPRMDKPEIKKLVRERFRAFLHSTVRHFQQHHERALHFIGSIAYHYREPLTAVCTEEGYATGLILQRPIERLVDYHALHSG